MKVSIVAPVRERLHLLYKHEIQKPIRFSNLLLQQHKAVPCDIKPKQCQNVTDLLQSKQVRNGLKQELFENCVFFPWLSLHTHTVCRHFFIVIFFLCI